MTCIWKFNLYTRSIPTQRCAEGEDSISFHGFCGIDDNIHEHLLKLSTVCNDFGQVRCVCFFYFYILKKGLALYDRKRFFCDIIDTDEGHFWFFGTGKLEESFDNVLTPCSFFDYLF